MPLQGVNLVVSLGSARDAAGHARRRAIADMARLPATAASAVSAVPSLAAAPARPPHIAVVFTAELPHLRRTHDADLRRARGGGGNSSGADGSGGGGAAQALCMVRPATGAALASLRGAVLRRGAAAGAARRLPAAYASLLSYYS
eukprot:251591-Chlamydomonas_euryale.AAC.1